MHHLATDNLFRFCKSAKVCITTISYMCFVLFPFVYYVLSDRKLRVNMDSFIVVDTRLHPTSSGLSYMLLMWILQ